MKSAVAMQVSCCILYGIDTIDVAYNMPQYFHPHVALCICIMTLYCMIVLLVKFTLSVAFLILMSAINLVNKDYYYTQCFKNNPICR